jgi:creatinine amidohydrolase
MRWEELTAKNFQAFVEKCGGVCVLPLGVVEKHGNHLPLGTDMITGRAVCEAATEREPAVVFPYYFFGQIAEARHYPGTVSISHTALMDNMLYVCDEIARNGLKKIFIVSSHGGNNAFLPFFAQWFPGLHRDYTVYTGQLKFSAVRGNPKVTEMIGNADMGAHAGLSETAVIMHLRPDLVHMEDQPPEEGADLKRMDELKKAGIMTGFNWYGSFPNHFAGDPTLATPELGKVMVDIIVDELAKDIRRVKEDTAQPMLAAEFNRRAEKPDAAYLQPR